MPGLREGEDDEIILFINNKRNEDDNPIHQSYVTKGIKKAQFQKKKMIILLMM